MGFFSELKNDLSQAVNTLMPEDKEETTALDKDKAKAKDKAKGAIGSEPEKVDIDSMLNRLDDIKLDDVKEEPAATEEASEPEKPAETFEPVEEPKEEIFEAPKEGPKSAMETIAELRRGLEEESFKELEEKIEEQTEEETKVEEPKSAIEAISEGHVEEYAQETLAATEYIDNGGNEVMDFEQQTPTDETASITEGMAITGDVQTTGSLDLIGKIAGNVKCLGKLNITGEITGDSDAAEIYAESARITGEVRSKGSVKVGQSTVIVGNIFGSSAVIAGAVKGDIDVHGPVVLDTTAIVMGNIKSQSVQINNGAVIEGMCSQAYADVNPSEFFETLKNR